MENQNNSNRYTNGILAVMAVIITTCLVYTSPSLNQADLFNPGVTGTDQESIYMPNYYADIGEEGVIEIKAKNNMKELDAISFNLLYSPATYLSFPDKPLVFDGSTVFQNIASQKAVVVQPGKLEVTIVLQQPIQISGVTINDPATHKTLFKIKTSVSLSAPDGEEIDINFTGAVLSNQGEAYDFFIPSSSLSVTGKKQASEFAEVTVTSINPNEISNKADANVVFSGTHLDLVHEVWIGKTVQTITNQTSTSLTVKIPANKYIPDSYYVTFYDKAENDFSVPMPLKITDKAAPVQEEEEEEEEEQELKEAAPLTPSGDSPKIIVEKAYITPTSAINDGKTPFSLYVLVEDKNNDIKSVLANLTKVGQVGSETPGTFGQPANNTAKTTCPTGSNFIACMTSTAKEGQTGQWFVLSDLTISKSVAPSKTPYKVEITVTDNKGNTDKKSVSVLVGDNKSTSLLKPIAAVAISKTKLEVLFNRPMGVSTTGKGFSVSSADDVSQKLSVTHATMSASGTVVTLTTADQVPGKKYVLSMSADVKDFEGKSFPGTINKLSFEGFKELKSPPVVDYIASTNYNLVELEFQKNLKLSSLADVALKIYESENSQQRLNVIALKPISGKILQVETDSQIPERAYRINIEGLASYDGTPSPAAINKGFKGFNARVLDHAAVARKADFNNDGRVDFADFTIFSSVYGTIYFGEGENLHSSADNAQSQTEQALKIGQPLTPDPDSLVPHTSEPKGGDL